MIKSLKNIFKLGAFNPVNDEKQIFKILLLTERGCILVVAIISGVAVAAYGYKIAAGYFTNEVIRWISAGFFFVLATAITDVGVKFFIQKAAYDFFAAFNPATYRSIKFNWFSRAMQVVGWFVMVGITAGIFMFDYVTTNSVRNPVANMIKKESSLNQDSLRQVVLSQENARVGATRNAITELNLEVKRLERQIESTRQNVGDTKLKQLASNGNGWAKGKLKGVQDYAVIGLNRELKKQLDLKHQLQAQYAKDLAYKSDIVIRSDSTVFATNQAIAQRNLSLVNGTSILFLFMGFWAKCLAGLIRILLVILFFASGVSDANGDGKIDYQDVNASAAAGFPGG
jgi:hypothetical protein